MKSCYIVYTFYIAVIWTSGAACYLIIVQAFEEPDHKTESNFCNNELTKNGTVPISPNLQDLAKYGVFRHM